MRLCQTLQGRRAYHRSGRAAAGVDCLCARCRAGQLDLDFGQADHADLCRAGHLVWRRGDLRRRPAHARRLCAWRQHDSVRSQSRLQENTGATRRVVRGPAAPAREAHPPTLRSGRRPQHLAAASAPGQATAAPGAQLWRTVAEQQHRDAHRAAVGTGGVGPVAGCLQTARQSGTQIDGARRGDPDRTRWSGHSQPRSPDAHH